MAQITIDTSRTSLRRIGKDGYVHFYGKEHILIAESALGKSLPAGAEVHHFDGNRANNENTNLVICEDRLYHNLLERRQRIVKFGGNPDTDKICGKCQIPKSCVEFHCDKARFDCLAVYCRLCSSDVAHMTNNKENTERFGRLLPKHACVLDTPLGSVICENDGYRRILLSKLRVSMRGGDTHSNKICSHCQQVKNKNQFPPNKLTWDGLFAYCYDCKNVRRRTN